MILCKEKYHLIHRGEAGLETVTLSWTLLAFFWTSSLGMFVFWRCNWSGKDREYFSACHFLTASPIFAHTYTNAEGRSVHDFAFLYMQVTHIDAGVFFIHGILSPVINRDTHTKMQLLTSQNNSNLNCLCRIKIKNSAQNLGEVSGREHKRVQLF